MATLILGTVGRALGGPLGGIVGTLLGGPIDHAIFGSGARSGSRLANLAVQSAAYGEPLPRIYGRMRVAGNLVWTAGIKESPHRSGSAKGGTATNTYSYSSSFAVIVAGRAIVRVARIWADGKLLRAADGTLNFPAVIRTYTGGEATAIDPLIAAAEGAGKTPAYRGRALVVFEDLPLADYGNRIPNLTFEVIADAGPVGVDAIAADIADVAAAGSFPTVVGFAAAQAGTIRQTLTTLGAVADLALHDDGGMLRIGAGADAARVPAADLGATDKAGSVPQIAATRGADATVPDAVWLSYSDLDRDFQTGIQAATRRSPVLRLDQHDLTITAQAGDVKALAVQAMQRAIATRTTAKLALPWRHAAIGPGDLLTAGDDPVPWRVSQRTITGAVIDLDLVRVAGDVMVLSPADAGRPYLAADEPQGATTLAVLDVPALPAALPTTPQLLLAAGGATAGWRRADVLISRDGGESYSVATSIAGAATLGTTLTALPPGNTVRWDRLSTLDIELASDSADLQSAGEDAVLAGANLAAVGDELIQFATVAAIGVRRYRLSTLLRGRRGSEAAAAGHSAGERFVLLDDRLATLDLPAEALGAPLLLKAVGPGDDPATVAAQSVIPRGAGLRPLSPAALTATLVANGDRVITWQRRSRAGFAWSDGTDAPLAEDSERYRVTIMAGTIVVRVTDVIVPTWTYAAADAAADVAIAPAELTVAVAQVSAVVGAGIATTIALP